MSCTEVLLDNWYNRCLVLVQLECSIVPNLRTKIHLSSWYRLDICYQSGESGHRSLPCRVTWSRHAPWKKQFPKHTSRRPRSDCPRRRRFAIKRFAKRVKVTFPTTAPFQQKVKVKRPSINVAIRYFLLSQLKAMLLQGVPRKIVRNILWVSLRFVRLCVTPKRSVTI